MSTEPKRHMPHSRERTAMETLIEIIESERQRTKRRHALLRKAGFQSDDAAVINGWVEHISKARGISWDHALEHVLSSIRFYANRTKLVREDKANPQ